MDTFLTESKNQAAEKSTLPESLLNEHRKLATVVNSFGVKVEAMIEKQRAEYVQAYGHHMRDVQKELHNLREKATAIANDRTRDEKLKKLDSDQKWYRAEAVKLDAETNILRKKLKNLTGTISSVERERDWLLSKLREANTKYNELRTLRSQKSTSMMEEGMSLLSNDSSYTLELEPKQNPYAKQENKKQQWKSRLENDYGVSRDQAMMGALSHMIVPPVDGDYQSVSTLGHGSQQLVRSSSAGAGISRSVAKNAASRRTLGKLVAARAKHESLADFVAQNANSARKGSFESLGKVTARRNTAELLNACLQHLVDTNYNPHAVDADYNDGYSSLAGSSLGGRENFKEGTQYHQLIKELACCHDTYVAMSNIMSGMQRSDSKTLTESPPLSPQSPGADMSKTTNGDEITFMNVESGSNNLSPPAPVILGEALSIDRDIAGYLNQSSERRIARLEAKMAKKSSSQGGL